jgi:hypothetical protein
MIEAFGAVAGLQQESLAMRGLGQLRLQGKHSQEVTSGGRFEISSTTRVTSESR